ncbi:MAG TPA: PrsW family intramembrane metalloprotease [Kofleriaceae bacterium]|nr:PrsW family intramembrane metalloprotease [Kofleriaceae bacterium]
MGISSHGWIAISGAVPAIIAMWLVDRLDAKRPEPPSLRRKVVLFGALSCIPAIVIETVLSGVGDKNGIPQITYPGSMFQAFVVAAMVEEACKISVVYWVVWKHPAFDERMDGIVYAARAGLGFALVENVGYLLMQQSMGEQVQVWILRAVLAIPGHAMWTATMGYFAARRRFDRWGPGLVGGYLIAVLGHGLYDYAAFVSTPLTIEGYDSYVDLLKAAPPLIIVVFWLMTRRFARTALRLDDADAARAAGPGPTPAPV